jgi:predicted ATP-grasp superfamily ATP-dependent carboligase
MPGLKRPQASDIQAAGLRNAALRREGMRMAEMQTEQSIGAATVDGRARVDARPKFVRPPRGGTLDVAVLDADERQSLVCVRSLGAAGLRVGVFGSVGSSPAFRSRWCRAIGRLPDCSDERERFVDAVLDLVATCRPRTVVTAHDGTIEALRPHRRDVPVALASEPALAIAIDKTRTLDLAASLGIGVPRSVRPDRIEDLRSAIRDVGLPAVVKPTRSWVDGPSGGARLISTVVVSLAEAQATGERAFAAGGSVVLQELVTGSREAVSLVSADGRVCARFAQVAHRMWPPLGGSSVLRESIPLPHDLVEAAEALVDAAGLDGYSEVEFRRDGAGRPRLMEINPRLSASVEVAVRSGVDFPRLLYAWATGSPPATVDRYRTGVRMRWLGGDIRWLRDTLALQGRPEAVPARRAVADFVLDSFRPAAYDYVDASDLRPALAAITGFALKAVKRRGGQPAKLRPPAPPA